MTDEPTARTGCIEADRLTIEVPDTSRNDERISVRVSGAPPGAPVEVDATLTATDGVDWQSRATVVADDRGVVDVGEQAPVDGTWDGVEPMGWLWSMSPDEEDVQFPELGGPTYSVDFRAAAGDRTAERTVTRVRWDGGISTRQVERADVVGTLYEPAGDGPHPAVIDLHGSAGRLSDNRARRLASNGYATLALHYFGDPTPLPDELSEVLLSRIDAAADWLLDQHAVGGDRVGLVGVSRGAELALLLGARRDWVGCIVSYSGSVPWDTPSGDPAWLDDGEPVPHLTAEKAPRFEDLDEKAVTEAVPAVDRTDGPVLLLSGGDDPVWNSRRLSEAIATHLDERAFPHAVEHRTYDGVGHYIGTPYHPLGGLGESDRQRATAHASEDSWPVVLEYLERGLDGD